MTLRRPADVCASADTAVDRRHGRRAAAEAGGHGMTSTDIFSSTSSTTVDESGLAQSTIT